MNQIIPQAIDKSWHEYLQPLFNDPKMLLIKNTILTQAPYYPARDDIFNVFKMPIDKVRVVILGQDPYSNGEANGYAFAVKEETPIPGSLKIIQQEIINSKVERDTSINIDSPKWKTLTGWRQQGVFLINTALTVEAKHPNSHTNYWQWFTREVIKIISLHSEKRPVWLLWGSKAKAFKGYIHEYYQWQGTLASSNYNYVLQADHPAAELYPDSKYKFSGCNNFNTCNQILKLKKQPIINW